MEAPLALRFALNHMVAPGLAPADFFRLAASLGIPAVEIRNDLPRRAVADGTSPEAVRAAAAEAGVTILSINALQRFDDWNEARAQEALDLTRFASASGARALVLVPVNDGSGGAESGRPRRLRGALQHLRPVLAEHGVMGLVEPLGFRSCSLRSKREAAEAIEGVGGGMSFRLVHDTFHHALAGEPELFPGLTGMVHISGVTDPAPLAGMEDRHRLLVDASDRLDTVGQINALVAAGYAGPFSFEPFAAEIHRLADPGPAIAASMQFINSRLATQAA